MMFKVDLKVCCWFFFVCLVLVGCFFTLEPEGMSYVWFSLDFLEAFLGSPSICIVSFLTLIKRIGVFNLLQRHPLSRMFISH